MIKKILAATALATLAGVAGAEMTSFRLGAAVGSAHFDVDCSSAVSCDKSATSYKIYGDYRLNDRWSVEGGYMKLNEVKANPYTVFDATGEAKVKVTAPYLALTTRAGIIDDLNGVIRVGLARVRTEGSLDSSGSIIEQAQIKVKPYLGLGLEYSIMPNLQAVVGADFTQAEVSDNITMTVRLLSLGVQYGF